MYTEERNDGIFVERQIREQSFSMDFEHSHPYCELFYLKQGSCIYSVNGSIYHLTAGDVLFVAAQDSHATRYEGEISCERFVIYFDLDCIPIFFTHLYPELSDKLHRSGKIVLVRDGQTQLTNILRHMLEESNREDKFSFHFLLLSLMEALLSIYRNGIFLYEPIVRKKKISPDTEEALKYIALNYAHPLTLEEVAAKINLVPTYLSRKFKKETGRTFKEYLNSIRMKQASYSLLNTNDSITNIALNCGFNSSNYFKDSFRAQYGVSPRTYRKQTKAHEFS